MLCSVVRYYQELLHVASVVACSVVACYLELLHDVQCC